MHHTLDRCIGNEHVKEELRIEIAACTRRGVKLPDILFTGGPGTGKTHFARAIANETGTTFHNINSPLVNDFFKDIIDGMGVDEAEGDRIIFSPALVFFDECHQLDRDIQEMLLKIMLEGVSYVSGLWYDTRKISYIYATTDADKMLAPLRQRCALRFDLRRYTVMEMAQILMVLTVEDQGNTWDVPIPAEVAHYVAQRSRFTPRIGQQYMERVYQIARTKADNPDEVRRILTPDIAEEFFTRRKITANGLTPLDFDYLRCLDQSRKPMGVKTIAAQLDVNDTEVQRNVEPFLRFLNLIAFTKSGRELTVKGKEVLRRFDVREYAREQIDDIILT